MSNRHKPIRDMNKRFQIILYHLGKIQDDWGACTGLSANDVSHLRIGAHAEIKRLFGSSNISAFFDNPFIPESEFDSSPEPQVTEKPQENKL